jgi:hypothetical protein
MAEIDIERKRRQSNWPWALAVLLLLMVVGAAWYFTQPENQRPGTPDLFSDSAGAPPATPAPTAPGTSRP